MDPGGQNDPAWQAPLHAGVGSPAVGPKVPPGHGVQSDDPARLYVPGGHKASGSFGEEESAGQANPALHSPLQLARTMPALAPYKPGAHAVHDPAPGRLYRPAGHVTEVELVDPGGHA